MFVEIIITIVIAFAAGYLLYKNIRRNASGKCSGCKKDSRSTEPKCPNCKP